MERFRMKKGSMARRQRRRRAEAEKKNGNADVKRKKAQASIARSRQSGLSSPPPFALEPCSENKFPFAPH